MVNLVLPEDEVDDTVINISKSDLPEYILAEINSLTEEMEEEMLLEQTNIIINYHNFYLDNIQPRELEVYQSALALELPDALTCDAYHELSTYLAGNDGDAAAIEGTRDSPLFDTARKTAEALSGQTLHKDDMGFELAAARARIGHGYQAAAYDSVRYDEHLSIKVEMIKNVLRLGTRGPSESLAPYSEAVAQHQALINMAGSAYNGAIAVDSYEKPSTGSQIMGLVGTAAGAYFGGPVGASIGGAIGSALGGLF